MSWKTSSDQPSNSGRKNSKAPSPFRELSGTPPGGRSGSPGLNLSPSGVLPAVLIAWGARGLTVIRERRLDANVFLRHLLKAQAEALAEAQAEAAAAAAAAESSGAGGTSGGSVRARAEALLEAHARASSSSASSAR